MATVEFRGVSKVFEGGVTAINDMSLQVSDGELLVMVGPSGCGKSTALRLIAGLEDASRGEILIDGELVNERAPQERDIAMVFQNYALYPHKTVRNNLDFPLRMMKFDSRERDQRIHRTADLLDLQPLLDRKPKQLSGGQRQRVAMGRALVRDPKVFLMDEPLSNLDAKLRVEIRAQIAELQKRIGITTLYVTHDQVEAMTLGERVAVLREGRLQQVSDAQTLYDRPVNVFVATFIGSPQMNIFPAQLRREEDGRWRFGFGESGWVTLDATSLDDHPAVKERSAQQLMIGLRPEAFVPRDQAPEDQRCRIRVHAVEALGHEKILYFESPVRGPGSGGDEAAESRSQGTGTMSARLPAKIDVEAGDEIELGIDTAQSHFFEPDGKAL